MTEIFDFCAFRTNRLLEGFPRLAELVCQDMVDSQAHLSAIVLWLDKTGQSLDGLILELQMHQLSCERSQKFNEECRQALESDDVEKLIEFRDRMKEAQRRQYRCS